MKRSLFLLAFLFSALSFDVAAQVRDNPELLAARGQGEVSHADFEARVSRIPPEHQFRTVRDGGRFEDLLNSLLIDAQLAAQALEAGFDQDPVVRERMALAAREELARAWIEHVVDSGKDADYTALAREQYLLNRDRYRTPETIDVAHILVGLDERSEAEALELAEELKARLAQDPTRFTELVSEYSDDTGSRSRQGMYKGVKRGDMVEPFETAAFALSPGDISDPVQTQYGYHIIRLDAINPPQQMSFDSVQLQLEEQVRKQHRERKRREALEPLYAEQIEVTQESMENAIRRVFGDEVLQGEAGDAGSQ